MFATKKIVFETVFLQVDIKHENIKFINNHHTYNISWALNLTSVREFSSQAADNEKFTFQQIVNKIINFFSKDYS